LNAARILIVDDHTNLRKLVRMSLALRQQAFEIKEAEDADVALTILKHWKPDVAIVDVMLPGAMDGLGICRHIRAVPSLSDIRILMLSARGQLADIEAATVAGANRYIVKPFSPVALLQAVNELVAQV